MFLLDPLKRAQIDQNIDERILIRNRKPVSNVGSFNPQFDCLRVHPFGRRALFVDLVICRAFAIQLMAEPGADTRREGGATSSRSPFPMLDGACGPGGLLLLEGTAIPTFFMGHQ